MSAQTLYAVIEGECKPAPRPLFRIMPIAKFETMKRARSMRELMKCFRPAPYTDDDSPYLVYKKRARQEFADLRHAFCGSRPIYSETTPLEILILIVSPLPKTHERKTLEKRPLRQWLTSHGKGDVDNLAKGTMDAANGVLWHDDRQVARLTIEKIRAAQDEPERVEFMLSSLAPHEVGLTMFERIRAERRESGPWFELGNTRLERWQKQTEWEQELPL